MLQLLQLIWLWAGTAVLVPVVIHLYNVKPGRTLKVGSILLLAGNAKTRAKSIKLSELLLLLLRCLLLITLTMILAKPVWLQSKKTTEKGWLLIPQNEIHEAYTTYQPLIDSLLRQGFRLRRFDGTFGEIDLQKALQQKDEAITDSSLSYWALLNRLENKIPDSFPLYIFTDNKLKHFTGVRPRLSLQTHWNIFHSNDTAAYWLQKAWLLPGDSVRITTGSSHLSGTEYASQNMSVYGAHDPYRIANNLTVSLNKENTPHQAIAIDTTSLTVIIYAKTFSEDAAYVVAALHAIKEVMRYNIKARITDDIKTITGQYDWLFWLSDEAMPGSLVRNNILMYANKKSTSVSSRLITQDFTSLSATEPISLYKTIPAYDSTAYQIIWKDEYGNPVLSLQKNEANIYRFYSHFNPQWNDLVWNSSFPQVMYKLMFNDTQNNVSKSNDIRMIDASQIQPAQAVGKALSAIQHKTSKDISVILWLMALFLFVAERMLSFRVKRNA